MLTRLADLGIRAPKRVLVLAALLFALAAAFGASAADHLSSGGFRDPDAASSQAEDLLQSSFDAGDANLILEVRSDAGVSSTAARDRGLAVTRAVEASPYASQVQSFWTLPEQQAGALRSEDGRAALVIARIAGDDNSAPERAAEISADLIGARDGVDVLAGGLASAYHQVNEQTTSDLAIAEAIAIPITVIVLIWVFGSLIAALLPLVIGLSSIVGTMAILRGLSSVTDVSVYALNMTTAMGLALAIDYSLFIVSRYREEVRGGAAPDEAVRTTMRTAGRTVLFSALTVGLSLAAMLVFPVYFLRSFAYAGLAVVALATIAALVLLPALLTALGGRVNSLDLRVYVRRLLRRPAPAVTAVEQGFWYRFATAVMRRALPVGLIVTAVLVAIGLPFAQAKFGYPDDRVLPHSASAHQVGDDLRVNFSSNASATISVVAPDTGDNPDGLGAYASELSSLDRRHDRLLRVRRVPGRPAGGTGARRVDDEGGRDVPDGADVLRPAVGRREDAALRRRGCDRAVARPVRRADRRQPRFPCRAGGCVAVGAAVDRHRNLRRTVPVHRQRRASAQGTRPEPALAVGDVRRDGVDLPGGTLRVRCSTT